MTGAQVSIEWKARQDKCGPGIASSRVRLAPSDLAEVTGRALEDENQCNLSNAAWESLFFTVVWLSPVCLGVDQGMGTLLS